MDYKETDGKPMRADRLISILMLLQSRGRLTAISLSRELEVSERTIYRDIDALCFAGVPIYAEPGPGGGFELLDHYRTQLTGLTESEVRAFFMLSIPEPLTKLGVSHELKAAMLKLSAALPDRFREDERLMRQRFLLDSVGWQGASEAVPHLLPIHQAVHHDNRLKISYRLPLSIDIEQLVDPLGLVAKAGIWYLVYTVKGSVRTIRISALTDVQILDETFARPLDFDLENYWRTWCAQVEQRRYSYDVTVRITQDILPELQRYFGGELREDSSLAPPAEKEGRIKLTLSFESLGAARECLLGFGSAVEVLEPWALRMSIIDFASQIVDLYSH
jgi:predicted DNA-binding transcriptional regulator YafY